MIEVIISSEDVLVVFLKQKLTLRFKIIRLKNTKKWTGMIKIYMKSIAVSRVI